MSRFYNAHRSKNLYTPNADKPFKLSRSKIDLFIECPRCFYVDRRLGTGRPPGFPFNLNSAVDTLLKAEFDTHRVARTQHPLLERYGVDARPVEHEDLHKWRMNFTGVQYLHKRTYFMVFGAIDDLWQDSNGDYIVVDYKATATKDAITRLDKDWHAGYKRQMEVYQWLLRKNGHPVSDKGYFVYCNGRTDREAFDGKLEFDVTLIDYTGSDDWVDDTLERIWQCLNSDRVPAASDNCDYCAYLTAVGEVTARETQIELDLDSESQT